MDVPDYLSILAIAICTMLMAVAVAVETALNSISRVRLREMAVNPRSLNRLMLAVDSPRGYISAAELAESLLSMINAVLIGRFALRLIEQPGDNLGLAWLVAILAILVVLLLGVVLPRTRAGYEPEYVALKYLPYLGAIRSATSWLLRPLLAVSRVVLRVAGKQPVVAPSDVQEGVLELISSGDDEGGMPAEEEEMLESLVEFRSTLVREVMVPRPDIVAVPSGADLRSILDITLESGYSRLPVYSETVDEIKGILYVKDLLGLLRDYTANNPPTFDLTSLARQPLYVPEAKKVDELLKEMRTRRVQMAVVVDEYGGTAGLVTVEDLLEEIVGEIQDEYDVEEPDIQPTEAGGYLVDARTGVAEVNELFNVHWDSDEYDTIGGLVFDRLGRIPVIGDEIALDGVQIQVRSTEGRRLRQLYLVRVSGDSSEDASEQRGNGSSGNGSRSGTRPFMLPYNPDRRNLDQPLDHNIEGD